MFLLLRQFFILGLFIVPGTADDSVRQVLSSAFNLSWMTVIPAITVVLMSLLRVPILFTMIVSSACAFVIAVVFQGYPVADLCNLVWSGYEADNLILGSMLEGGGITSMSEPLAIVGISACYGGIFMATSLLTGLQGVLRNLSRRITPAGEFVVVATVINVVACF